MQVCISSGVGLRLPGSLAGSVGPAFQNVADIDRVPGQAHGLYDLGQQLAGPAHKWLALLIFVGSGSLSNEHEFRLQAAHPKYHVPP